MSFRQAEAELQSIDTSMFSPPEFVDKVIIAPKNAEHDVVIQIYFQEDVIPGDGFNDQFLYVGAMPTAKRGASVEWSCGLRGIDQKYMPARCEQHGDELEGT